MRIDMPTGSVFGYWTILAPGEPRPRTNGKTRTTWQCRCICGTEQTVLAYHLRSGHTKSCGCQKAALLAEIGKRNGYNLSTPGQIRAYKTWMNMLDRCYYVSDVKKKRNYKDRGIKICDEWRSSFLNFLRDMGERPSGYTIERLDNDKGYSLDNCIWATTKTQNLNRRNTIRVSYCGVEIPLVTLCENLKRNHDLVYSRLKRGLTLEEALDPTLMQRGRKRKYPKSP